MYQEIALIEERASLLGPRGWLTDQSRSLSRGGVYLALILTIWSPITNILFAILNLITFGILGVVLFLPLFPVLMLLALLSSMYRHLPILRPVLMLPISWVSFFGTLYVNTLGSMGDLDGHEYRQAMLFAGPNAIYVGDVLNGIREERHAKLVAAAREILAHEEESHD